MISSNSSQLLMFSQISILIQRSFLTKTKTNCATGQQSFLLGFSKDVVRVQEKTAASRCAQLGPLYHNNSHDASDYTQTHTHTHLTSLVDLNTLSMQNSLQTEHHKKGVFFRGSTTVCRTQSLVLSVRCVACGAEVTVFLWFWVQGFILHHYI